MAYGHSCTSSRLAMDWSCEWKMLCMEPPGLVSVSTRSKHSTMAVSFFSFGLRIQSVQKARKRQ